MPRRQTLSVAELRALLRVRFSADQRRQSMMEARIRRELGDEPLEETPETIAVKSWLVDWISDVLACRLMQDPVHETPLLSSRDYAGFVSSMISKMEGFKGDEFESEDRKTFERTCQVLFEHIVDMVAHAMAPSCTTPYEKHWRWVTTVLDLASERGTPPTELLDLDATNDEVTRRMFTKEQYVALSKRAVLKLVDTDAMVQSVIKPMLVAAANGDEEQQRELERELEALMPSLREQFEAIKRIVYKSLDEEVERIYVVV